MCLHLRHGRASSSDSHVDTATTATEEREDEADSPGGEGEPEEGGGSLQFAASTGSIVGSVGEVVGLGVRLFSELLADAFFLWLKEYRRRRTSLLQE